MSVTTLVGSGQRASSLLSENWAPQMPDSRPSSPLDKFPTIDEETPDSSSETPVHLSTKSIKYAPSRLWQPRRTASIPRLGIGAKHRPRKSISETFGTMRTRSVSANAQEIAEALKAPVSYRLIVRMQVHDFIYVLNLSLTLFEFIDRLSVLFGTQLPL